METKEIRVSEATTDLMQAIGRLQDSYFDVCRAFEGKCYDTNDFTELWNALCEKVEGKIGGWIMKTFVSTANAEI